MTTAITHNAPRLWIYATMTYDVLAECKWAAGNMLLFSSKYPGLACKYTTLELPSAMIS